MRGFWLPYCLLAGTIANRAHAQDASPPPAPGAAESAAPPASPDTPETAAATRRRGLTAGVLAGLGFGTAHGYPNDFGKIDVPAYRSATSGAGSAVNLYVGGALADWFTFAFGVGVTSYGSSKLASQATVFAFHLEAFPAFFRGGLYRDAALFADFGTGVATIKQREGNNDLADSGSLSMVGLGALFELWRLGGHLAFGPYASWHYQWSDSMSRQLGELGVRGAFYGGP